MSRRITYFVLALFAAAVVASISPAAATAAPTVCNPGLGIGPC